MRSTSDLADLIGADEVKWRMVPGVGVYEHELWVRIGGKGFRLCTYDTPHLYPEEIDEDIDIIISLIPFHLELLDEIDGRDLGEVSPLLDWQVEFLCLLQDGVTVIEAAARVGISKAKVYWHRRATEAFREAWSEVTSEED